MKKKLKLLTIIPNLMMGGIQSFTYDLLSATLNKRNYEHLCVILSYDDETIYAKKFKRLGFPVIFLGKTAPSKTKKCWQLFKIANEFKPDLIHNHAQCNRWLLPVALLRRNIKMIHTIHNMEEHQPNVVKKICNKLLYKTGVVPVAVSERVKISAQNYYGFQNILCVMNGIDLERLVPLHQDREQWKAENVIPQNTLLIACVARLAIQKNHQLLLKVFQPLVEKHKHIRLLLVGDGPLRNDLAKTVMDKQLSEQVMFLGDRDDIPEILNAVDMLVLSSDFEGNPIVVLEAMIAGRPVVATKAGGVPEVISHEKTGLLVNSQSEAELYTALDRMVEDEVLRKNIAKNAQDYARLHCGIDKTVAAYESLYLKALKW